MGHIYIEPADPFILFSIGVEGYEGEEKLWNLPRGDKASAQHIVTRVKNELDSVVANGGQNLYPFGTHLSPAHIFKKVPGHDVGPVQILFTINNKDLLAIADIPEPSPNDLRHGPCG